MKRILAAASLAALMAVPAANVGTSYMVGATWNVGAGGGGGVGISARILTTIDAITTDISVGGGVTYYLNSGEVTYDAIAAFLSNDIAIGGGYDFVTASPVFSLGMYQ